MKKRKILTLGLISLTGITAAVISISAVNPFKLTADATTADWRHFAAVMPTETTQGIREYWTDCIGGNPHFTKPSGISAKDQTLTGDQINAILANQKDERIIPTLDVIQKGVTKGYDGSSAYHHDFVEAAYAYNYLDSTTKAKITGWNDDLSKAKAEWESHFKVVYDANKDGIPVNEQTDYYTWSKSFDEDYGYVFKIEAETPPEKNPPYIQFYSYGYGIPGVTYNETDKIHFAVKSPFDTTSGTSQTTWCGNYGTAKKIALNSTAGWSKISEYASDLNSDGTFNTSFNGALSVQRYHAKFAESYSCEYYLTSIYAEDLTSDGAIVQSTLNTIQALPNGSWPDASTVTKNVSTPYGTAVKIDVPSKTSALEFKWSGVEIKRAQAFEYLELYVYAPVSNEAFFVSQKDWRNAVMNVSGLPSDSDNGTKANTAAGSTAILAQGWNKISFPVQNFEDNNYSPAGTMYFQIWARTTGEQSGWLVTDIKGYRNKSVDIQQPASTFAYSFTGTIESYEESSYPGIPFFKASVSAHKNPDRFALVVNEPIFLGKYSSVKFIVKSPRTGSFAMFYDFIKGSWWPVGKQVTPGVTSDAYTEFTYSAADINAGFSWNYLKMGLLCIGSGNNATGDWYIGVQLIK